MTTNWKHRFLFECDQAGKIFFPGFEVMIFGKIVVVLLLDVPNSLSNSTC